MYLQAHTHIQKNLERLTIGKSNQWKDKTPSHPKSDLLKVLAVWKLIKSPPCMWYSAGWQNKGLLFCYKQLFEQFSNVFWALLLVQRSHPSRFNQSERRRWTRSQSNSTSNAFVNYLTWPFPALLITRDWCITVIIIGFKVSSQQKTTLNINSYI